MTNPFDDIIAFYRNMEMEERAERDNDRDRLARIVYAKPVLSHLNKKNSSLNSSRSYEIEY